MKRCVVFAHYDSQGKVENYVLYYLKELKKAVDFIVFVSDCELLKNENEKVLNLVNHCIIGRHGEYDFGSYKRGFFFLKRKRAL